MDGEAFSRRLEGHRAWTTSSKKRIHRSAWKLHTKAAASPASPPSGLYGTFSTGRRRTTARHLVADPEAAARSHLLDVRNHSRTPGWSRHSWIIFGLWLIVLASVVAYATLVVLRK